MAKGRRKQVIKVSGAGDVVEAITKATGIKKAVELFMEGKDCGCDKRKEWLNQKFPIRTKVNCFNESQYNEWGVFMKERTIKLSASQVKYVCELYADIFSKPVYYPCTNCSPKPLIAMIDKLDIVYNSYQLN